MEDSETVLQWIWAMGEDNLRRKLEVKEKAGIRACVEVNMHGEREEFAASRAEELRKMHM